MKPTKQFFEDTIVACKKEQDRLRMDFERQEGVVRFCQMMLEKGILEGEEELSYEVENKETAGR